VILTVASKEANGVFDAIVLAALEVPKRYASTSSTPTAAA
jgi:hypothetical protein